MPHQLFFLCWKHDGGPSIFHGNGVTFLGRYGVEDRFVCIGHGQEEGQVEGTGIGYSDLRYSNVNVKITGSSGVFFC